MECLHFLVILIAGLSTILRPSVESDVTLFRLILPILLLWLFICNAKRGIVFLLISVVFLAYSLFVSYTFRFHSFSAAFNFHYLTVIFFYFYYVEVSKDSNSYRIYRFLSLIFKILIILGIIQYLFGGVYFNTQDRTPAINIIFWNENEFSSILAIFTPLFFLKETRIIKYFWLFCSVFIMLYNDSKLAVLSVIIFFGGWIILKSKFFRLKIIGISIIIILLLIILYLFKDFHIQGDFTVNSFVSNLLIHTYNLEPLEHIGTFNSRSNGVILGVKEFINSYFLGIGPGNSNKMMIELVKPGTERYAALSMHNFTLQIVTEMGILGLLIIYFFYKKVKNSTYFSKYPTNLIYVFYLSCIISVTLLSGIWSNYFYLFILFYSIDFFKDSVGYKQT